MSNIVGVDGKPLRQLEQARMAIYLSEDKGESWIPVKPYNVPEWLKHPDIMADMVEGYWVNNDDKAWYRAEVLH